MRKILFVLCQVIIFATSLHRNAEAKIPQCWTNTRNTGPGFLPEPFNQQGTASNKIQALYPPYDFDTMKDGTITAIYFMLHYVFGQNYYGTYTFSNLSIKMGYYPTDTFPSNTASFIPGLTPVLSASTYSFTVPGPDYDALWIRFPLTTPFVVNSKAGKILLVEISQGSAAPGIGLNIVGIGGSSTEGNVNTGFKNLITATPVFGYDFTYVGVPQVSENNSFQIYSTEIGGKLGLKYQGNLSTGSVDVKLINTLGQTALIDQFTISGNASKHEIDVSNLARGLYVAVVEIQQKQYRLKVVL